MPTSIRPRSGLALTLFIAIPFIVGGLGSLSTFGNVDGWYAEAVKAPWTPPNVVFGPVWSVLYLLIGLGGWLAWREASSSWRTLGLRLYVVQLVLNAIWTPVFFSGFPLWGRDAFWQGVVIIVAMDVLVFIAIFAFSKINTASAVVLSPYLVWLTYATTLNVYLALNN